MEYVRPNFHYWNSLSHIYSFLLLSEQFSNRKSTVHKLNSLSVDCVQESAKVRPLGKQTTECTLSNDTGAFQFVQVIYTGWAGRECRTKIRYKKYHFYIVHNICIFTVLIYKPLIININRIKL